MNCPACDALNPATAEWCGQCLQSLRTTPPDPAPALDPNPTPGPGAPPDLHTADPGTPPTVPSIERPSDPLFGGPAERPAAAEPASEPAPVEAGGSVDRGFRTVDGEVEWRCRQCDQWNPLLLRTCACGAHLGQEVGEPDPVEVQARLARTRRFMWGAAIALGAFAVLGVLIVVIMAQSAG